MSDDGIRRIGVLTGGGDCPGLNAVIRAVVKTAVGHFGWQVVGIEDGFEGLILPGKTRELTFADVRGILPLGGTILGTTNRANPFDYPVTGEDGRVAGRDMSSQVMAHAEALGLDGLVVIGGDGSLHIAQKLYEMGLPLVGVPKTIDNDVGGTDLTFGFDTALDVATQAIDRLHTTAESHHRIMLVEVMGRNAGWLALQAGLAGGADAILLPEIPFDVANVDAKVEAREMAGSKFSIVVVAEGARPVGGEQVYQEVGEAAAARRLGGVSYAVAEQLSALTEREIRVTVLGHLQRGGSPTSFDRILATRFGAAAVDLLARGRTGHMVSLRGEEIVDVPIAEAIARLKTVPLDGDLVRTARCMGISLG
ncbi:MAG: ATP-dependent 6-phosphofructokinase [Anaerolineae bacterium]|jgi:6-phosphofructokinase 1|nr:ATP-dependent 6-phosphofructokinase [Anaerolineae bacterium]MDX9832839.1 ATP-dependent 6-phosphofructokinase [Anaerolineae bacterium]